MAERAVEPLSDAEINATLLLYGELLSHPDVVRVCRELQALRAAAWDVLTIEPDWGESHQRLRALLPAARVEEGADER